MAKRLISMDILRGWAILLMVIFHVFLNVSDLVPVAVSDPFSLGLGKLILVVFISIFIHWQSLFLMISATVHWFTMSRMHENGQKLVKIFLKQLIFGIALYVFGFLREPLLSPWGITADWFRTGGFFADGTWSWDKWTFIYRAETLSNIGFSIVITAIIFTLFTLLKREKLQILIKVGILAIFAAVFIFVAPIVQNWVSNYAGVNLQETEAYVISGLDTNNGYYNRWLLNSLAGREFPIFPNYGYFLIGCIFGLLLSQPNPSKKMLLYTSLVGVVLTLGGFAYWALLDMKLYDFGTGTFNLGNIDLGFHVHPTGFVLFSIGLQMMIISIALRMYEFNHKLLRENRQSLMLRLSRWIRRWGVFALTIFVFNIFEIIPRGIFTIIYPAVDYRNIYQTSLGWTLIMVGLVVLMWEGIIRLICLLKGYTSVEFVFLVLFKFGKKPMKKDPLNLQGNLREVEPILFVSR
ncbi:MAG: hypothetical protein JW776_12195 [Candidatus Lokiarchaeota archaeon]|nr:hypothetical protein [Candidatus Lokiarchaeota archaeon]